MCFEVCILGGNLFIKIGFKCFFVCCVIGFVLVVEKGLVLFD